MSDLDDILDEATNELPKVEPVTTKEEHDLKKDLEETLKNLDLNQDELLDQDFEKILSEFDSALDDPLTADILNQLMSKEVLFEPLQELHEEISVLEDDKSKKQTAILEQVLEIYREGKDTAPVMDLLQEMQEIGPMDLGNAENECPVQ